MNELPLYPSEALLWDENLVPLGQYYGGKVMALPKLNLQFLTPHDYLLRYVRVDTMVETMNHESLGSDYSGPMKNQMEL